MSNNPEITFADFVTFIANKPADELIEHTTVGSGGNSWKACAVGKFAESAALFISDVELMIQDKSMELYVALNDAGDELEELGEYNISTYGGLLEYINSLNLNDQAT